MAVLEQLLKELQVAQKHTRPAGTHSSPSIHGNDGLFGICGMERDLISSRVLSDGLASVLPAVGSVMTYPLYGYLVGRDGATGSQPANKCDDPPVAGAFKSGFQTAQFGHVLFDTRELDITRVGQLINAGEETDLRFVNDPLASQIGQIFPNVMGSQNDAFDYGREVLTRIVEVGEDFKENLSIQAYTGTGTGTQFAGLEKLVATNIVDAKTGITLTSLGSDVRTFGDVDVTTVAGSAAIVSTLISMVRFAKQKAKQMRLNPVQHVLVMRSQMLQSIADAWPCQMNTFGCQPANANVNINVDAAGSLGSAIDMKMNKYLLIDAERIDVIEDDWMPETDLGENLFSSDIYLLPLTVANGKNVLRWEYMDYSKGTSQAIRDGKLSNYFWSDDGKYLWAVLPPKGYCNQWRSIMESRLVLRTPQLAGRLSNVATTLGIHYYDPATSSASYYVGDDGNSTTPDFPPTAYGPANNS